MARARKAAPTADPPPAGIAGIRDRILELRRVPARELLDNPKNWRRHPDDQRSALRGLLEQVGLAGAVVARKLKDGRLELIDGHLRKDMDPDLQLPTLVTDLSQKEADLMLAAMATRDVAVLRDLLARVETDDAAVQALLARITPGPIDKATDPGPRLDKAADLQKKYRTAVGQLWTAGRHRLLCGDARTLADVQRLAGGEKAALFVTDPPYLVGYTGADRPKAGGGKVGTDWSTLYDDIPEQDGDAFYEATFRAALEVLDDRAAWYCWHAHKWAGVIHRVWRSLGILDHQEIVWVKPVALPTFSYWPWQHEPCLVGFREGDTPPSSREYEAFLVKVRDGAVAALADLKRGPKRDLPIWRARHEACLMGWREGDKPRHDGDNTHALTTVWEVDREEAGALHPTAKPPELWARPMRRHTWVGEWVLDLFLGSGTAAVAAEQEGRRCLGMELSPTFLAVSLDRLERMGLEVRLAEGPTGEVPQPAAKSRARRRQGR